jgi:1-acyl-sn-glycerol-3-phosphate acyltransferase
MKDNPQLPFSYRLLTFVFRLLFRLFTRLDLQGLEKIPREGPLIITVNHLTVIEAPLVLAFSPRQPLAAFAKQEYKGTLQGKIIDQVNPIYVKRGEVDRTALKEVIRRLKEGDAFGIAPEGTRSSTGQLMEGKEGVAYIAMQSDAQIFPVAIWGHENALAELKRFKRPTIHLRAGEAYRLEPDPALDRKARIEAGTERIMLEIARLLPSHYHGVYADKMRQLAEGNPRSLETET